MGDLGLTSTDVWVFGQLLEKASDIQLEHMRKVLVTEERRRVLDEVYCLRKEIARLRAEEQDAD